MNFLSPFSISALLFSMVIFSIFFYSFNTKVNVDFDEMMEIFKDMPDKINKIELENIFKKDPLEEKYLKNKEI